MTQLLMIGGSDAGISAALRARELDPAVEITIVLADSFSNYSICGLPFYLSGEVADWHNLAHRQAEDITKQGIQLLMNHWAESIDPTQKIVTVKTPDGQSKTLHYDKLILGTGGTSVSPPIIGGKRKFQGSLGTQVVKIFEIAAARTGLRDDEAIAAGLQPLTVETDVCHHKAYYPGAHSLRIRVTGDRESGRLLGAQIAGHYQGEVAKRIDIFATALFHDMTVNDLNDLDLSYTPPLGSPWDAVQMAAQAWTKQCSK
jgi:NADPH-dependent 2,4-dienoyl-CoA reductase/sulfur reductase-like enzyme